MTASIQIKSEKYYVVLSWKTGNKRKQKWINTDIPSTGNNKRKAEQKRVELLKQWENTVVEDGYEDIMFSDFLRLWLEERKFSIKESTYCNYKSVVEGVICAYFDRLQIKIIDLKPSHIQQFYTQKMNEDGVSANTVLHYHAYIHSALSCAVNKDLLKTNPSSRVELPKRTKHIADFYTPDEMETLLRASMGTSMETVVLLAAWFGLRRGEIIGMKWSCIDFNNATLTVRGTMTRTKTMSFEESAKTSSSIRTFPMTGYVVTYLKHLKDKQERNKSRLGAKYHDEWKEFVCVHEDGRIISLDYVSRHFPMLCKEYGLRQINLHSLRHSNISLLISAGAHMKEIQEWAGHSNYTTTANIYAHLQSQSKVKLSNSVQNVLAKNISLEIR